MTRSLLFGLSSTFFYGVHRKRSRDVVRPVASFLASVIHFSMVCTGKEAGQRAAYKRTTAAGRRMAVASLLASVVHSSMVCTGKEAGQRAAYKRTTAAGRRMTRSLLFGLSSTFFYGVHRKRSRDVVRPVASFLASVVHFSMVCTGKEAGQRAAYKRTTAAGRRMTRSLLFGLSSTFFYGVHRKRSRATSSIQANNSSRTSYDP